ncbi:hypothetical protein [Dactylosporangium darangshiense]|uniref:Uncharacterized protein n=1 Tax=Dactylosporangium darangshiense TaxID=579108 RepID=A0ABP8DS48_9ACTN
MECDGFAVRLDWPAVGRSGTVRHEFTQFTTSLRRAARRAESTRRFWSAGPLRPLAVTVVPIARVAYRAHVGECASARCPTTAPLLGMSADADSQAAQHPG